MAQFDFAKARVVTLWQIVLQHVDKPRVQREQSAVNRRAHRRYHKRLGVRVYVARHVGQPAMLSDKLFAAVCDNRVDRELFPIHARYKTVKYAHVLNLPDVSILG